MEESGDEDLIYFLPTVELRIFGTGSNFYGYALG